MVKAATGSEAGEGYDEGMQVRMADDVITLFADEFIASFGDDGDVPPVVFSSGFYYLAFLGTPSAADT